MCFFVGTLLTLGIKPDLTGWIPPGVMAAIGKKTILRLGLFLEVAHAILGKKQKIQGHDF